tara:strand:+ start:148772 stop:150964 length:2193 start_codon:yes stop_codon:yes gene_type:complete
MKNKYAHLKCLFEKVLFFIVILCSFFVTAQNEGSIWYFGTNAGLDFNTSPPTPIADGQINTLEGSATIADANGQILFYTDGTKAYDRNHNLMPNGAGGLGGDSSSSQSAVVVPYPGYSDKYFLFTVSAYINSNVVYSIVDMSLNNGMGDIVTDAKAIPVLNATGEYIQATLSGDRTFWWVLTHKSGTSDYYAFKLTNDGIDLENPVISSTGTVSTSQGDIGFLKFNNIGTKIVRTSYISNHFNISDFDNNTGVVSNTLHIPLNSAYGAEFSPNSRFLYVSAYSSMGLKQYDLEAGTTASQIAASAYSYSHVNNGALQSAPDGKIYSSRYGASALDVIHAPNLAGASANFQLNGQALGGASPQLGLTNIISSLVSQGPPAVSQLNVSDISFESATLHANVLNDGGATISERGFYFGTSPFANENQTFVGGTTGEMSFMVSGLEENTVYYFSAFAINEHGTTHLEGGSFTTEEATDTEPPLAMCHGVITIQLDENGNASITPEMIDNGSTDNEGIENYSLDITEFSCSDIGENTVIMTVTDFSGNKCSCTATVIVEDILAPKISEIEDHTIDLDSAVTYFTVPDYFSEGQITVTDNCTGSVDNVTQTPLPGTLLEEGIYTITFSATDDYQNIATHTFEIIVTGTLSSDTPSGTLYFSVYPNPASTAFNLLNTKGHTIEVVSIYDLQGRLVHTVEPDMDKNFQQVDVSHLATSVYAVVIQADGKSIVKRLIIK